MEYSADDGLPAETVNYSYDLQGELTATGGATAYLDQVVYDPFGEPQRTTYGLYGKQLVQTYTRDPGTSWLTGVTTNLQTLASAADTIGYTYNPAGALTSASDAQNTDGMQTQCYTYNNLGELTTAWTDTKGTSTQPAPSVTGIGGCITASPSSSTIGGPAPYWQTYTYDLLGDRTQAVFKDTSGNTSNDTTQISTYPWRRHHVRHPARRADHDPPVNHGFLGKPADPNTSIDLLGARNYDPTTGRFLSLDPVFEATDPLAMGGYAYADNNPATNADPSGLMLALDSGGGCPSSVPGCPGYVAPQQSSGGGGFWSWVPSPVRNFVGDFVGGVKDTAAGMVKGTWNLVTMPARDAWHCATGSLSSCGSVFLDAVGIRPAMQMSLGIVGTGYGIYHDFATGHTGRALGTIATFAVVFALTRGAGAEADSVTATADSSSFLTRLTGAICGGESFAPSTRVLTASGRLVAISELKKGQKVLATDLRTGIAEPETVSALMVHHDRDLYDLRVNAGSDIAVVRTTRNHLFWDVTKNRWVQAAAIPRGDKLRTSSSAIAVVLGGRDPYRQSGWMWDLTVSRDHDF